MSPGSSTLIRVRKPRSRLDGRNDTTTAKAQHDDDQIRGQFSPQRLSQTRDLEESEGEPCIIPTTFSESVLPPVTHRGKDLARNDYRPIDDAHCQTVTISPPDPPLPCNADNQLRALLRFSTEAEVFCPSYMKFRTGQLPTYVSQYAPAEISSACSCFELTIGCCTTTSSISSQTSEAQASTVAQAQLPPSPQPRPASSPSPTSNSMTSIDLATEDSTFSRPQEYSGPPPTSEATITATVQGPTSVPPPSRL
ncbi:MAG: hypothetical protein Q9170_003315 [Blastenia crenularia]